MILQGHILRLDRCPHCSTARPSAPRVWSSITQNVDEQNKKTWAVYVCNSCGNCILCRSGVNPLSEIDLILPEPRYVSEDIPLHAKEYLSQAISSLHAPAGSVMLSASSVDAMLKSKGYRTGSLYERINKAAEDHLITKEMADWAHEVRLGANGQRHADEDEDLPDGKAAEKCIRFAEALAQFLFVLPAMVERGRDKAPDFLPPVDNGQSS